MTRDELLEALEGTVYVEDTDNSDEYIIGLILEWDAVSPIQHVQADSSENAITLQFYEPPALRTALSMGHAANFYTTNDDFTVITLYFE